MIQMMKELSKQLYLVSLLTSESGTDDEARNEHKKKVISLFASNSTIEKE